MENPMLGIQESYETLLPTLQAIPAGEVEEPRLPAETAAQEAVLLHKWAQPDRTQLQAAGLDTELLDAIPEAVGALRYADGRWTNLRFNTNEAREEWLREAPGARDTIAQLMHAARYALRNEPSKLRNVRLIARGDNIHDMIQDFERVSQLGRMNSEAFEKVGYTLDMLEQASKTCARLSELYGNSQASGRQKEAKLMRDRASTYLARLVREVRECGQFVFWRNPARAEGYASDYARKARSGGGGDADSPTAAEQQPEPACEKQE
jgi:hypothetical protein